MDEVEREDIEGETRPSIELQRRHDELDLLLPVAEQ
jgi:hypothetical protein